VVMVAVVAVQGVLSVEGGGGGVCLLYLRRK
jgi:hypothetical protein